jgi:hypothetical protein
VCGGSCGKTDDIWLPYDSLNVDTSKEKVDEVIRTFP